MSRRDDCRSSARPPANSGPRWWAAVLGLVILLLPPVAVLRAQTVPQAAVVVRYGDGTFSTHCVDLETEPLTGLELLTRSGLNVIYEGSGGFGARVCKIGPDGCDDPRACFCRCQGTECLYWSYWHLVEGSWQYSVVGASSYRVQPGTVEGWSWGIGTPAGAPQPPVISFEEVCRAAPAALLPTTTPLHTMTPSPTPSPRHTPPLAPTRQASPTSTPVRPTAAAPTRTVPARPSATSTETAVEPPAATAAAQTATPAVTSRPDPSPPAAAQPGGWTNYLFFGGILAVLVLLAVLALRRRRQ